MWGVGIRHDNGGNFYNGVKCALGGSRESVGNTWLVLGNSMGYTLADIAIGCGTSNLSNSLELGFRY